MSNVPTTLKYSRTHEWIREDEEYVTVGITDHAQCLLGDLVYVELPEVESGIEAGEECAVIESVKAAADVYCPIAGEVIEVNNALNDHPQLINEDPYGKGWLFRIRPFENKRPPLLNAVEYNQQIDSEAH